MAGGRIKGITIELNGDSTKLEASLKSVNSEIRNTESKLKDVNKLLKMDPGNTNLLSQKYKTLQQEIGATKEKLNTLKEAAKQADQALADGKMSQEQYDALQREIAETEQDLKSLEQEYKNFGSVQAQQVAAAGEKMKELGGKMESAGKTLTTHVTLPLAAVGAAGVASFAEVDKTMQLTNKTMGNTEEQAELLNKAMKEAAANSTFGMKDAATATLNFARAGLSAEEAASALAPAMNLAAGEGGNLDTVSGGLVATINGFHGGFDDAGHYADVFAAACNNSALDVDSLSHAMSVAAPIFSSAGYSVNDAALYMGIMANNGIDADKAANSLKTGLARLVSPAKEGAEMMDKLGISVTNSDGTMKSSIQIQKELHDAFGKLSESEQIAAASAIFGKNQMAPWLALINTAPEEVGELDTALANCAGTTDEMAEAMMSGFGGSLEKLKSSIDVLVTSIGEALAPTILKVATFIQNLVDKFNSLTPAQQQTIVKIGMVVAAIGPLLVIIGKLLTSIGTIMTWAPKIVNGVQSVIGIGSKLMGGLKALWAVIMANPIVLIVAAIAAAVAAFIYFWNTSEEFRNFWIGLWEAIKTAVSTVVQAIATFFTETIPAAFNSFVEFFQGLWEGVSSFFSGIWDGMKDRVHGVGDHQERGAGGDHGHRGVLLYGADYHYPSVPVHLGELQLQHFVAWVQHQTICRGYPQIKSWKFRSMKMNTPHNVPTMLDDLNLPVAALRWKEIVTAPELADFTTYQLFREVLEPQYIETMNNRYRTNLRLSKLIDKSAITENLVTSSKRRYNDAVVQQLLSFRFAEERLNVGVYGITEAGKSYFMSAFCNEACHRNYRCMFVDYCDLLDELLVLSRRDDLDKYRKKLKYYARIQILFIDDFAISRYSEDGIKILYHLIKTRTDLKTSTMFTSQYAPSEWGKYLSDEENCYGKLDGIRRRLTTGYTVHIEKL